MLLCFLFLSSGVFSCLLLHTLCGVCPWNSCVLRLPAGCGRCPWRSGWQGWLSQSPLPLRYSASGPKDLEVVTYITSHFLDLSACSGAQRRTFWFTALGIVLLFWNWPLWSRLKPLNVYCLLYVWILWEVKYPNHKCRRYCLFVCDKLLRPV